MSPFGRFAVFCFGVLFVSTAVPPQHAAMVIWVGFGVALMAASLGTFSHGDRREQ